MAEDIDARHATPPQQVGFLESIRRQLAQRYVQPAPRVSVLTTQDYDPSAQF